jgi:molecular chaperone HtpG
MKDMAATGGGGMPFMGQMPETYNVSINANHPLSAKILAAKREDTRIKYAKQAYDLALLSQNMLDGASLTKFIERSVELASK